MHSTVTTARLEPPTQKYVHTEIITVHVLVDVTAISAGEEVLLHVPPAVGTPELRGHAKVCKRKQSWLEGATKHEAAQRKTARPF